ncbi:hypothetical protein BKA00_006584 [Actinomadura coerulea]|uniref:DUF2637 domain-containing protein n=1 Tax=Actinomadura coerulea TaxID=46159 RepID=A0A7X0G6W9_9ACTN|nr:DUF2637 domain-containing protein [Actinomadura coerulea]MBB6399670.1 hypothetical protein [Actinomadura coerulea]GGQ12054.1 hypothetical protein GCM10010187_30290 [Actinomadura coerulea]
MPTDPTRPSYTAVQRRLLTTVAGLVVAALAGGAFALTYDVLRELAEAGGVGRRWAPLYPAMADTLTAVTILSLVVTRNARWWTRLPRWTLLALLLAGGAAASVQHSVRGFGPLPDDAVRTGVAVAPHAMLVIAVWLWLAMVKHIRVARPAAGDETPVEAQRGHVKVLGPAAPALALEAPAAQEAPGAREAEPERVPAPDVEPEPEREPILPFRDEPEWPPAEEPAPVAEEPDFFAYEESLSSEPAPPLDPLPQPRLPLDAVPDRLPTDVELVRGRDRAAPEPPPAATTRPDIVVPPPYGTGEDDDDGPPADRAEDPDAGDPDAGDPDTGRPDTEGPGAGDPATGDHDTGEPASGDRPARDDGNPPPSGNFRSGPVPPAE